MNDGEENKRARMFCINESNGSVDERVATCAQPNNKINGAI